MTCCCSQAVAGGRRTADGRHRERRLQRILGIRAIADKGIAPDTFTDGVDVVVEGRMATDGTFHATTLLAKCASRYENAPDKYKQTPGYKQAGQTT